MSLLFKNNATGRLKANTTAATTLITLDTGEGARFPQPAAGDWFQVTLEDRREGKVEICRCTARSADNLTVLRAQEGTVAQSFLAGAIVSNRFTAQTLQDILDAVAWDKPTTDARFINASGDAMTGPLTVLAPVTAMEPTTKQYVDAKPGFPDAPNDANMYGRQANAWIVAVRAADYTAADVLTKIKSVDGTGSGLDADLLDGQSSAYYATATDLIAVDNQTDINTANIATLTTGLSTKANIDSPALTGVPTAPTPSQGTNTQQLATTEFVMSSITTSGGFPEAPNDGGIYGRQSLGWRDISPDLFGKVAKTGDTMTGHLALPTGPAAANAVRKDYVDGLVAPKVNRAGDTMTGNLTINAVGPVLYLDAIGTAAQAQPFNLKRDGVLRWFGYMQSGAASGFGIGRCDDSGAFIDSPFLIDRQTGNVSLPIGSTTLTRPAGSNDTSVATTAFVVGAIASKAPLADPIFTGDPKAPTPAKGDNDTSIATTAFVAGSLGSTPVIPAPDYNLAPVGADGVVDLNTIRTPGWAPKMYGPNNPNLPMPGTYWYIQTVAYLAPGYVSQVAYPYAASGAPAGIMIRACDNNVWGPWNGQVPAGAVEMFARSTPPVGWLKANGATVNRVTYAALFAAIGGTFGAGDGSTTFQLPDLRGVFLRGLDDGKGIDVGRTLGTAQEDGIASHTHSVAAINTGYVSADHTHVASGTTGGNSVSHTHTFSDASSATGTGSANHTHASLPLYDGTTRTPANNNAGSAIANLGTNTSASGAAHTHTVAVSGTTGGNSVSHTHTFSDTTTGISVNHVHTIPATNTGANTGAVIETRPRNIALLACIKF
jgi:microcystin-dependent protein